MKVVSVPDREMFIDLLAGGTSQYNINVHMYIHRNKQYVIPALFCLPSLFHVDQFCLFETLLIILNGVKSLGVSR